MGVCVGQGGGGGLINFLPLKRGRELIWKGGELNRECNALFMGVYAYYGAHLLIVS